MAFTDNNKSILTCDDKGYLKELFQEREPIINNYGQIHDGEVWSLKILNKNNDVVLNIDEGCQKIISIKKKEVIYDKIRIHNEFMYTLTISKDFKYIFTSDCTGYLKQIRIDDFSIKKNYGRITGDVITAVII